MMAQFHCQFTTAQQIHGFRVSEFQLRERGIVAIRENHPFIGRVTLYYTPPEGFIARSLELPERAFMEELNRYADRKAERAKRLATSKNVEQPAELPPRAVAAPLQTRKLVRQASGA